MIKGIIGKEVKKKKAIKESQYKTLQQVLERICDVKKYAGAI